jgi:hypothetical protein
MYVIEIEFCIPEKKFSFDMFRFFSKMMKKKRKFIIDLNKLQVQINKNRQIAFLVKKRLNGEKNLFTDMIY